MASSGSGGGTPHSGVHAREIAIGLASAVNAAIASGYPTRMGEHAQDAGPLAWTAAADVAELLDLPGLTALLMTCAAGAVAAPTAISNALERLARLARETSSRGDMVAFARADRELATIARGLGASTVPAGQPAQLAGAVPSTGSPPAPEDVRSLDELLVDFSFDDPAAIAGARVTLPVAAGLRAALDWIAADAGGRLHVELQDAALTIVAFAAHEAGLAAAGAVLGLTGGALLPELDGRWALRVPLHSARPAFLLARQGDLLLALPWHSVARLRIVDKAARAAMAEPWLAPWSPLAGTRAGSESTERPAALLALGLMRAWLQLDQVVWRVFAEAEPAETMDALPGSRRVVRTEEGEEYRVVEVDQALRGVPPIHTPSPRPRGEAPHEPERLVTGTVLSTVAPSEPEPGIEAQLSAAPIVAQPAPAPDTSPPPSPEPMWLDAHWVRPIGLPAPAPAPAPAVAAEPALRADSPPARPGPEAVPRTDAPRTGAGRAAGPRRALIVDDSLVARMELGRVLERHGWEVEWVETASEMWSALPDGGWSIVFVDVSLPDARGRAHLSALVTQRGTAREPFELVALTRDEADETLATGAGISRVLRKPFGPGTVERMVRAVRVPRA